MSEIKRIGIDNLKPDRNRTRRFVQSGFTLALDEAGHAMLRVNLRRAQMVPFFRKRHAPALAVALANKMARIAWAMMKSGEAYRQQPIADAVSA